MANKDSFILYTEQKAVIDKLSDEQAGKLIKAIYEYVEKGEMPELDNTLDLVITPFKTILDKNKAKYEEVSKARAKAGAKGGKQKKQDGTNESKDKQKKQMQTKDNSCDDNDNESDNDNVNVNDNENKRSKKVKKESFDELIDSYTSNEQLREELKNHLVVRKAKKGALTNRAIELSLKELDRLTEKLPINNTELIDENKIRIVQQSIIKGWVGFFEVKENTTYKSNTQNNNVFAEIGREEGFF